MLRKVVICAAAFAASFSAAKPQETRQFKVILTFSGLLCDSAEQTKSALQEMNGRPMAGTTEGFSRRLNCTILPSANVPHIQRTVGTVVVGGKAWDLVEIKIMMMANLFGDPIAFHVPLESTVPLYTAVLTNVHADNL